MILPRCMEPACTQDSTEQQPSDFEMRAILKIPLENIDQGKEHHLTLECCIHGVCPEPRSFRGVVSFLCTCVIIHARDYTRRGADSLHGFLFRGEILYMSPTRCSKRM
jgi:hypothetical protein